MKLKEFDPMRLFQKGLIMEQRKDPAFSREIQDLSDPEKKRRISDYTPVLSPEGLTPDQIIYLARRGRIVDERDGLPLFRKLWACQGHRVVILVDAIDDEPYISSQLGPTVHLREELAAGAALARKAIGATDVRVQVYRNIADLEMKIPRILEGLKVERIGGVYPAEIRGRSGIARGDGVEYLYLGACALIHLCRAAFQGLMQTTAFVTVGGDCVESPANLEVSLGTTATQVLEACKLSAEPTRIVVGGSMTGVSIEDTDLMEITPVTRAILAFREDERDKKYVCIGCGRCSDVCPAGLNPMVIYRLQELGRADALQKTDYQMCIGCMACSYRCPAKLDLAQRIYRLKRHEAKRREARP